MQDLEVLLGAQELSVVVLRLLLGVENLMLLGFYHLFEFGFLGHHELMVVLLALELALKSTNGCRACLAISLVLDALCLNLLQLRLQLVFFICEPSDFECLVCLFLSGLRQLLLEFSDPVLVHHHLLLKASLITAELVHRIRCHSNISLQVGTASFV